MRAACIARKTCWRAWGGIEAMSGRIGCGGRWPAGLMLRRGGPVRWGGSCTCRPPSRWTGHPAWPHKQQVPGPPLMNPEGTRTLAARSDAISLRIEGWILIFSRPGGRWRCLRFAPAWALQGRFGSRRREPTASLLNPPQPASPRLDYPGGGGSFLLNRRKVSLAAVPRFRPGSPSHRRFPPPSPRLAGGGLISRLMAQGATGAFDGRGTPSRSQQRKNEGPAPAVRGRADWLLEGICGL